MKPDNSFPEIGDLLRSQKPDATTPPGLETRILRALDQHARPVPKRRLWAWFVLPPAFAAIALVLLNRPHPSASGITHAPAPVPLAVPSPVPDPVISMVNSTNPLLDETVALTRDVERASGFLINCLPSVGTPGE